MKLNLMFTCLLAIGSVIGQESTLPEPTKQEVKQQFGYVSAGVGPLPIPLPIFAAGYRAQSNHHGVDLSLQVCTIIAATDVKANVLYLHYFKPSLASEFYVGGGVGPAVMFGSSWDREYGVTISPEFVFGKQYRNESNDLRFFQLQASFPTFSLANDRSDYCEWKHRVEVFSFPLVVISYGLGF